MKELLQALEKLETDKEARRGKGQEQGSGDVLWGRDRGRGKKGERGSGDILLDWGRMRGGRTGWSPKG